MKITNQQLTMIIAFICIIGLGAAYSTGTIKDYRIIMLGFLAIFISIIAQPIFALWLTKIMKKAFGLGTNDYWQMVKEEIIRTGNQYSFYIKLALPQGYYPIPNLKIQELDLMLYEINREDIIKQTNDPRCMEFDYPVLTIIQRLSTQKFEGILRKDLNDTIKYITENIEIFSTKTMGKLLPILLRESMGIGTPQEIAIKETETAKEAKK